MDRVNEYKLKGEKMKEERLSKAKLKEEMREKEFTFKPQITKKAQRIGAKNLAVV